MQRPIIVNICGVTNRKKGRLILLLRPLKGMVAPGVPVDGVVGVLKKKKFNPKSKRML
jgi:hypothetical protein